MKRGVSAPRRFADATNTLTRSPKREHQTPSDPGGHCLQGEGRGGRCGGICARDGLRGLRGCHAVARDLASNAKSSTLHPKAPNYHLQLRQSPWKKDEGREKITPNHQAERGPDGETARPWRPPSASSC